MKLFFLILLFPFVTHAELSVMESSIQEEAGKLVSKECDSCTVRVDFPLQINEIKSEKLEEIKFDHNRGKTLATVRTDKQSRRMSFMIRWFDQVVMAKKNIRHGSVIGKNDVKIINKDITFSKVAYVGDVSQVVGMIGKRKYKRGQIIDENTLKRANVVKYGQPIKLNLEQGHLSMTVSGKARGAGAVGEIIPVQILKTKKKVMAKIIDNTTARMQ